MAAASTRRRKKGGTNSDKNEDSGASSSAAETYNNAKSKKHPSARPHQGNKITPSEEAAGTSLHHLLPLPLVLTVLICSGFFWISCFRDVMATGKPILDTLGVLWGQDDADINLLQYTKSTDWFDDSRGWKSKQGGLSTILAVTTDANNMGGLFIRKMAGVAGLSYHTTKLLPIVFQSAPTFDKKSKYGRWVGASYSAGHYDPLLTLGMIGDVCISMFYVGRLDEMKNAGATGLGMTYIMTSFIEAFIFGMYLISRRVNYKTTKTAAATTTKEKAQWSQEEYDLLPQEDPNSLPSRIVARTVFIISSLISIVALRDILFPGTILPFIPRDDIYLEWTGAFLHSPPPDTVEADEHGLEAPLFAGDKFVAQLFGLYLSLGCMIKLLSAGGWSKGNRSMGQVDNVDRSGVVSSKLIWKAQAFGDVLLLGILRLFTPAAKSASLDLRWHLMLVAYEAFILFLYGFW